MKNIINACLVILFLTIGNNANAGVSPLGVSLFPPAQFPGESFTITGARVNLIMGEHMDVYGFDLGSVGNVTKHNLSGVQAAGIFNWNKGESTAVGAQVAGIANINVNKSHLLGIQAAGILNSNSAESSALGIIVAAVNLTEHTTVMGVEAGLYNKAGEVYGFQIGLINHSTNLHGIQIGLVNFNDKGMFAVSPILNVGF